jgi:hypothetical protein
MPDVRSDIVAAIAPGLTDRNNVTARMKPPGMMLWPQWSPA